jgi:hypothetical protein
VSPETANRARGRGGHKAQGSLLSSDRPGVRSGRRPQQRDPPPVTDRPSRPTPISLRPAPGGLATDDLRPPVIAASGDPFSTLKVLQLLARIDRGRPVLLDDVVDALNAAHVDWLFDRSVVSDVALALRSNWLADYRNTAGFVLAESPYGPTIAIEDSSRVDPWIVRQVDREVRACRDALLAFSRLDRLGSGA